MSLKAKLVLKCDEDLWNEIKIFKISESMIDINSAVLELLRRGLKSSK